MPSLRGSLFPHRTPVSAFHLQPKQVRYGALRYKGLEVQILRYIRRFPELCCRRYRSPCHFGSHGILRRDPGQGRLCQRKDLSRIPGILHAIRHHRIQPRLDLPEALRQGMDKSRVPGKAQGIDQKVEGSVRVLLSQIVDPQGKKGRHVVIDRSWACFSLSGSAEPPFLLLPVSAPMRDRNVSCSFGHFPAAAHRASRSSAFDILSARSVTRDRESVCVINLSSSQSNACSNRFRKGQSGCTYPLLLPMPPSHHFLLHLTIQQIKRYGKGEGNQDDKYRA